MAAAFRVTSASDIATAFAAHDEFQSRVAKNFWPHAVVMMERGDDFYTAPYCILKKKDDGTGTTVGYIVFTSYKARNPHYEASNDMKYDAPLVAPCTERVMETLEVGEDQKFAFREYAWAGGDDVDAALEDKAVRVTCEKMGWAVPSDWRKSRKEQSKARRVGPVWDLEGFPPTMPNPYPPRSSPQAVAAGLSGRMQGCWTQEVGESMEDFLKRQMGDIHQKPQDHLEIWKEKQEKAKDSDKICAACGKDGNKRCTRCKRVVYCGRDCQKADWKEHKKYCVARAP